MTSEIALAFSTSERFGNCRYFISSLHAGQRVYYIDRPTQDKKPTGRPHAVRSYKT